MQRSRRNALIVLSLVGGSLLAAEAPASEPPSDAQILERSIRRSAESMTGLCGIRSTTHCEGGVCAVVHDISPSPMWVFWESPTLLFAAATKEAGAPDITGCAGAIDRTEVAGTEVCHHRARSHAETSSRKLLCSAYSVEPFGGPEVVAACNRAAHAALGVDGLFDDRRPYPQQAGDCPAE